MVLFCRSFGRWFLSDGRMVFAGQRDQRRGRAGSDVLPVAALPLSRVDARPGQNSTDADQPGQDRDFVPTRLLS